jgi:Tol biopolymer transport system component
MQTQWYAAGSRILFMDPTFRPHSVPTDGSSRTPSALGDSTQSMGHMRISPDGRWLAYVYGTTSADPHVFVQSFAGSPARWQISSQPAIQPRWTRGGKELVYEELSGHIVAVPIDAGAGFHAGVPVTLFTLPEHSFGIANASWNVSDDGSRFFLVLPPQVREAGVVEVVTDFASLVGRH